MDLFKNEKLISFVPFVPFVSFVSFVYSGWLG
jgi:hypothetical protein